MNIIHIANRYLKSKIIKEMLQEPEQNWYIPPVGSHGTDPFKDILYETSEGTWICSRCGYKNPVHVENDYVNECWNCHMPILGSSV